MSAAEPQEFTYREIIENHRKSGNGIHEGIYRDAVAKDYQIAADTHNGQMWLEYRPDGLRLNENESLDPGIRVTGPGDIIRAWGDFQVLEVENYLHDGSTESTEMLGYTGRGPYWFEDLFGSENGEQKEDVDLDFFSNPDNHPGFDIGGKDE